MLFSLSLINIIVDTILTFPIFLSKFRNKRQYGDKVGFEFSYNTFLYRREISQSELTKPTIETAAERSDMESRQAGPSR